MDNLIYDDFLGLNSHRFHKNDLVVFYGESGSGKSTAIEYLLGSHPDFSDKECFIMRPRISGWEVVPQHIGYVVVDEVFSLSDMAKIAAVLNQNKKVLVASHVKPMFFHLFFPHIDKKVFVTDKNISKLANYLNRKNITFSDTALDRYGKRYGATYTDIDIILEHTKEKDFDRALVKFEKFCSMRLS